MRPHQGTAEREKQYSGSWDPAGPDRISLEEKQSLSLVFLLYVLLSEVQFMFFGQKKENHLLIPIYSYIFKAKNDKNLVNLDKKTTTFTKIQRFLWVKHF